MKNKGHILILLVFLLIGGMIVSPVMAENHGTCYFDFESSYFNVPDTGSKCFDAYIGDSQPIQLLTPDQICSAAGYTHNDAFDHLTLNYWTSNPADGYSGWAYWAGTTAEIHSPYTWSVPNQAGKWVTYSALCTGHAANMHVAGEIKAGASVTAPTASFTCTPVSQFPDENVVCTDTSSNTPTDWLWTLDYEALGIKGYQTSTSRNFTWQSHYTGIFGVNLWANNSAGGSWYNRSNYVEISDNATPIGIDDPIPAGYIRSMVQCVNPEDSSLISDCAISIKDIEGNAWSNGSFHGTWFIDTLPLHHINAYGSASGYTSASRLNLDASSSLMYELFLFPGYLPPASDGHVRLYAIVNDYTTGAPVLNAQVEFKGSGESTQIKYTSVSGIAQVEWANTSTVYVSASKAGYSPASRTIVTTATGPDTVRLELSAPWVTLPVTSGTPLPGELTVRPTQDPNKNPDGSYVAGYSNIKGQEMMNWLAENGFQLVQLCFFVTILGLLGVKLGSK